MKKFITVFGLTLVAALIVFGGYKLFISKKGSSASKITASNYQAVFLTNGQVYFGKLKDMDDDYPVLEDVYYLVTSGPVQDSQAPSPAEITGDQVDVTPEAEAASASTQTGTPSFTLVKLGNEIHAPRDKLIISRQQILFIEDLKDDGKLAKAIVQAKEKEAGK